MSKSKAGRTNWERWNTHETLIVEQEVFGHIFRLAQDPNSEHLGTTVWDASIVLAKMLEKNIRKGEFARTKITGKRAIELGAGMGLGGMAFALLGADVVLTDTVDVLPLLKRNCDTNMGVGKVKVCELDWMQPEQVAALKPPFDYVLAADCIYHETIVEHFHRIVMDLTNEKSTVVVVNELRSQSVHSRFMELFSASHVVKKMPFGKMDPVFQHPAIAIYVMKKKRVQQQQQGEAGEGEEVEEDEDVSAGPAAATKDATATDQQNQATADGTASDTQPSTSTGCEASHAQGAAVSTGVTHLAVGTEAALVLDCHSSAACSGSGVWESRSGAGESRSGYSSMQHRSADATGGTSSGDQPEQVAGLPADTAVVASGAEAGSPGGIDPADGAGAGGSGPEGSCQACVNVDWQARRTGVMLAKMLAQVEIPEQS